MPTVEWNRLWSGDMLNHREGGRRGRHYGDQWGDPDVDQGLQSVRDRFLTPFVDASKTCLEIGPGGGRWTQYLLPAKHLYLVDLNPAMFAYIIERFGAPRNIDYIVTHGSDIPLVPHHSIDFAFTCGTFVHLDLELIGGYLASLRPLMKAGAHLSVQFSDKHKKASADETPASPITTLSAHRTSCVRLASRSSQSTRVPCPIQP